MKNRHNSLVNSFSMGDDGLYDNADNYVDWKMEGLTDDGSGGLTPTNIIICDTNGVVAVSESTVNEWIAEANRIYRQVAMTFTLESVSVVTNRPDWFDIGSDAECYQMFYHTNNTGGLELYCVNTLPDEVQGLASPSSVPGEGRGIAVRLGAHPMVFAHEAGHACWLQDIPVEKLDNALTSPEMAGGMNWSGGESTGYYLPSLSHKNLVKRLLMYGRLGYASIDIPLGPVKSLSNDSPPLEMPFAVGLLESMTRQPEH